MAADAVAPWFERVSLISVAFPSFADGRGFSLAWALREEIRKRTDLPVVKVIVSHYHADHIYGLQVFEDEGADLWYVNTDDEELVTDIFHAGQRSLRSRIVTFAITWPTTCGSMPRRLVSTSGSSGIPLECQQSRT